MNNLIKRIFNEAGFEFHEKISLKENFSANFSFFTRTDNKKFDFYLVANYKEKEVNLEELHEQLDQFLDSILIEMNLSGIDKNLSFILLLETESINYSKERTRYIYNLEEDPYDFKKYVLTYTKSQIKAFEIHLNDNNEEPLTKILNNLLLEKKFFTSFKKKSENRSPGENEEAIMYDLVSKLFIKLPFLSVNIKQENLLSLKKEIDNKLSETQGELVSLILEQYSKDTELHINDILTVLGVEHIE